MRDAKRLLASSKSVKETALCVGYKHVSNFCGAFHKSVGCQPGEYANYVRDRYWQMMSQDTGPEAQLISVAPS